VRKALSRPVALKPLAIITEYACAGNVIINPASGEPTLVEDWTVVERQRQVLLLRRHHAGNVPEADGEETLGFAGHEMKVRH
jgi:hypothetical protein